MSLRSINQKAASVLDAVNDYFRGILTVIFAVGIFVLLALEREVGAELYALVALLIGYYAGERNERERTSDDGRTNYRRAGGERERERGDG